jgi:hypothetical protein
MATGSSSADWLTCEQRPTGDREGYD